MPKYKLKLEKYTLPDAIKKYNDKVKLKENNIQKDEISKKLKELEAKYKKDQEWSEEDKAEKNKLLSKLTKVNNAIYEIKAELNNSTVNLNNANIKELNTNISDITSLINNNKQFNSIIGQQISELLSSQLNLNKIFETENFKDMLKDIVEKVNNPQNEEIKNKIEEIIKKVDNNNTANDNYQDWISIRDEIKEAIPEDLQNIIKKYGDDIKKINELKSTLYNIIFKKDIDNVSENELDDYSFKVMLLSNLYDLVEEELLDKYFNFDPNNIDSKLHIKRDDLYKIINDIREWFSDDEYNEFSTETFYDKIISNLNHSKILSAEDVKDIKPVDISNAINLIQKHIKVYRGKDNNYIIDKPSKLKSKKKKGKGLDLDEIHNMNIMNGIIKSLDNIIYNQNRIIELLSKQNISKQNISEKPLQKLGRFKVEKYKPNMSITEFKKLFDSKP